MTKKEKINVLESFYSEIENISELNYTVIPPSTDIIPEEMLIGVKIEYFTARILSEKNTPDLIKQRKDEAIDYLIQRISTTSNVILKAKYNNFAYILTTNNTFCQESIFYYQEALIKAFADTQREYYELRVDDIFEKILDLSIKIKYKIAELKSQIKGYLKDETIADSLKTRLFLYVKERNIFSAKESTEFSAMFISFAGSCSDTNWVEHNLNLALFFAQKNLAEEHQQQQMQAIYELLGDNECKKIHPEDEKNLAVPHMNERIYEMIINYYEKAKCEEKLKKIWELHKGNKKNKKYIPMNVQSNLPDEFFDTLNSHLESISNMSTIEIVANLVSCQHFLFVPDSKINESLNSKEKYFYKDFLTPVQCDTNSNHKKIDQRDNDKFFLYGHMMKINIDFILKSILSCIEQKKLSYRKLYSILSKHTSFGIERQVQFGEKTISYTWLSIIDVGLESFFEQFKKIRQNKAPDYRVCIDVLTPKFEGILRDILEHNGANLTKLKDGNTSVVLLDKMLRLDEEDIKEAFYKTFDDNDLNFFQYAFSSKAQCLNIRSSVAHSFYIPQQYTLGIAIVVILGILRLAKFSPRCSHTD